MSRVFGRLVATRARLYEHGLLPVHRLKFPVVSVGNLTVGGTGKTPLVIALAERLRDAGHRPVILSRGYRRKSRGVVVVSRGSGPEVVWTESGDEPCLMAERLAGVGVVVGGDRHRAGLAAQDGGLGNLFLLDDGFQHRRLHRDVDIVTIDAGEWIRGERLLPSGRWREPKSALERAHAACLPVGTLDRVGPLPVPTFEVTTQVDGIYREGAPVDIETLGKTPLTAFAGIAGPERFFGLLETLGLNLTRRLTFQDHHAFTPADLERIGNGPAITTEKDAVRLGPGPHYSLRISANISRFNELQALIEERI